MIKKDIKVTNLGSGTCVPLLKKSSCSILMEINKKKLLFDSGPGTLRRLLKAGTEIVDIDYIFYSHFYPDHICELIPFLFALKYPLNIKKMSSFTIIAPKVFIKFSENLNVVFNNWLKLEPGIINIKELNYNAFDSCNFDNFFVESCPAVHNPESIAYKIVSLNNISAIYSGDTDYSENLIYLSKSADLLICEKPILIS